MFDNVLYVKPNIGNVCSEADKTIQSKRRFRITKLMIMK